MVYKWSHYFILGCSVASIIWGIINVILVSRLTQFNIFLIGLHSWLTSYFYKPLVLYQLRPPIIARKTDNLYLNSVMKDLPFLLDIYLLFYLFRSGPLRLKTPSLLRISSELKVAQASMKMKRVVMMDMLLKLRNAVKISSILTLLLLR